MSAILIPTAAIIVSIVVAIVQYAQWRTTNEKVVIDLSERRLKVYQQLAKAIGPVARDGEVSGAAFQGFMIGQADATFLFGDPPRYCNNKGFPVRASHVTTSSTQPLRQHFAAMYCPKYFGIFLCAVALGRR